jgi:exonuclease III
MSILSWNCWGLGNHRSVRDLCRLVKEKRPSLVFLMETKMLSKCLEKIRVKIGFRNVFGVDSVGRSGGLALFWNDSLSVEIQNFSRRHINAIVGADGRNSLWKFTGF